MKRFLVLVGALTSIGILGWATPTQAEVITYNVNGIASGALGGTPFTDALVTVELTADTSGVTELFPEVFLNVGTATLTIAGLGTATFNGPDGYAAVKFPPFPPEIPEHAFGIVEFSDPAGIDFTAILALLDPSLAGYDLRSSFGPLAGAGSAGATHPGGAPKLYQTTAGALSFTRGQVSVDPVTLTVTVAAVPEPASLSLFGLVVAGGIAARRRRQRQNS